MRSVNNSDNLIVSKQREIDEATRDAYLYGTGMIVIVICMMFLHAWAFYLGLNIGGQLRIITMGAIYHKVCIVCDSIQTFRTKEHFLSCMI